MYNNCGVNPSEAARLKVRRQSGKRLAFTVEFMVFSN